MIRFVRTATLLSVFATAIPALAQDGNAPIPAHESGAAVDPSAANAVTTPAAQTLAPSAELTAQAQRLRMLDVGRVQVVKLNPAQAAQISGPAGASAEQRQTEAAAASNQGAVQGRQEIPADTAGQTAPGGLLASFVEDTLNQVPVVQTALLANDVNPADVLRIDIHDNNDVTIYTGGGR